ncbi:MAG: 16S rRNA (adenine(1518)-N(6)/adenine(1519)-N(6))-dimethyltransferase RsmA [Clostridia bacterium]
MTSVQDLLRENNFRFNKQFGQNFITDTNLLQAMVADAGITENDVVIEIGAGAGTLTRQLGLVAKKVIAFEIDRNLQPILAQTLDDMTDKVEVLFKDFQKVTDEELFAMVGNEYKVVANLPYYITTPLIMRFLEIENKPLSITVMIQKEVGERIVSTANSEEYGVITLAIALEGDAKIMRVVPRTMFVPQPKVDSCIIRIDVKDKFPNVDKKAVKKLVKACFSMRRKTLANNLAQNFGIPRPKTEEALGKMQLDTRIRGEVLDINQYIELNKLLKE